MAFHLASRSNTKMGRKNVMGFFLIIYVLNRTAFRFYIKPINQNIYIHSFDWYSIKTEIVAPLYKLVR